MVRPRQSKSRTTEISSNGPFRPKRPSMPSEREESRVHLLQDGIICDTDARGHSTPNGRSPLELVLDATEGFIPLWAEGTTLRWRFQERSLELFQNPDAAREALRGLFGEAVLAWGDACPVTFHHDDDLWDFEIVVRGSNNCNASGCVLASAFFPDGGRHALTIYPKMFDLPREEQVETLVHELGHVFGLRHFFANISETRWPSVIFGTHRPFSIMNYGEMSKLTEEDKSDLKSLYAAAWSGELTAINGTPIRLVRPYSMTPPAPPAALIMRPIRGAAERPAPRAAAYLVP